MLKQFTLSTCFIFNLFFFNANTVALAKSTPQELRAALSKAIDANDLSEVQNLITQGAPLNIPSQAEVTDDALSDSYNLLLRGAVAVGSYPILQYLLGQGAELETQLPYNVETGTSLPNILIDVMRSDSPDTLAMINALLQAGANPNLVGNGERAEGDIPLFYALDIKNYDIAQALLNYHADPNIFSPYHDRVLVSAINMEDLKAVRLLLDAGADVNLPDKGALTLTSKTCHSYQPILPLDYVQERSEEVFVQIKTLLVQAGAHSIKDFCQDAGTQ